MVGKHIICTAGILGAQSVARESSKRWISRQSSKRWISRQSSKRWISRGKRGWIMTNLLSCIMFGLYLTDKPLKTWRKGIRSDLYNHISGDVKEGQIWSSLCEHITWFIISLSLIKIAQISFIGGKSKFKILWIRLKVTA